MYEYAAGLDGHGIGRRWLHFVFALHIHDYLRVTPGLQGAFDVSLLRAANKHACYANESDRSALALVPPTREPMLPGMANVCGARRGTISCSRDFSMRCVLDERAAAS